MAAPRPTLCSTAALALWVAAALSVVSVCTPARAESALQIATNLRGRELGRHIELLEDPQGTLGIDDVTRPEIARRFEAPAAPVPNFGFTPSVYWIRLRVENASPRARPWLLELAYPQLDEVTLYLPNAEGGFDARQTGDMRPFRQRDIAYRNFVFSLSEPARGARTLYLRVFTTGSVTLPLVAWSLKEFLEHQHLDWAALCIFYGVALTMACYNLCVFVATRQRLYLTYAGYIASVVFYEFTLVGHTFQFFLPNNVALAHDLLPASGAVAFGVAGWLCTTYLPRGHHIETLLRYGRLYCLCLAVLSFIIPYAASIRLLTLAGVCLPAIQLLAAALLVRRRTKQARLFLIGWASVIAGALFSSLQHAGILPASFATIWSLQIGISIQVVLLASGLADEINTAHSELDAVNLDLSHKLDALSTALTRADDANQRAERATRVRDEFVATMSHEFRTPLNPIINIPQGLRAEFQRVRQAACSNCRALFELEAGERLSRPLECPACSSMGSLHEQSVLRFAGNPARARNLLTKIERSGVQLLQVVNGILDFSKLEAGQVRLARERFEPASVVREALDEMAQAAQQAEIELACSFAPDLPPLHADAQRIRQVLVRLLENAIRFRNGPGRVTVAVDAREHAVLFSVEDQGIGISKTHFESIFASFEQVHKGNTRRYGGTGLGLSIARSLVRMHGGELWVESRLGAGSTFFISIPRQAELAAPLAAPAIASVAGGRT
jgi:signal transduction histidine kinase